MTASVLTAEQAERYARHLVLAGVGPRGQERLLSARVLIVGVGGLGSAAALYLAAAGVGTLGLCDPDRVELSNLQRQVLYRQQDVSRPKVEAAQAYLSALNPDTRLVLHPERLDASTARDLVSAYQVVVSGLDDLPTRYVLNDACMSRDIPLVDASIERFEGHLSVFRRGKGCLRCLFPTPPPPPADCATAGILGAVAGHLGTLQAVEVLKLLLGIGQPLEGRLWVEDTLSGTVRVHRYRPHASCPHCGHGSPPPEAAPLEISPEDALRLLESRGAVFVDVRSWERFAAARIPGSRWLPEGSAAPSLPRAPERPVVVVCEVGVRSRAAAFALRASGADARSLAGGMRAWRERGYPVETGEPPPP